MENVIKKDEMRCPKCGMVDGQMKNGRNRSGTQTMLCRHCKKAYTPNPKRHAYNEEVRNTALKIYYSGVSGRGVGKVLGINKANVYNWIKKRSDCGKLPGMFRTLRAVLVGNRGQRHGKTCIPSRW